MQNKTMVLCCLVFILSLTLARLNGQNKLPLDSIKLPPGFKIELFAPGVDNARSMTRSPKGIIFVGTRQAGNVYAVIDKNNDHKADEVITIASGLQMPNGVAFRKGSLYIAEIHRVLRYDGIEDRLRNPPPPIIVNDSFPTKRHHGWKFIRFGPDNRLYVPVGAPCNVCDSGDPRFATIMRMKPDGTGLEIFAHGVRNTVGFDWHPGTKELWFTDNGRDWMGDNMPPDELNHAPRKGMHFGFPFCHGTAVPDPKFGKKQSCGKFTPPVVELGPHVASLGMRFYTGKMFPKRFHKVIFIAEHGSWNRSEPIGYRVTNVFPGKKGAKKYQVFAEGWINGRWGRPVDILVMPDGSLLVSDDRADAIYRITYKSQQSLRI